MAGRVIGARPGQRIVVYARSGPWWVQPGPEQPFITIQADSKWSTATHLGYEYAALLVGPTYHPPPTMDVAPTQGGSVVAVTIVKGVGSLPPNPTKPLRFSGYDWRVRTVSADRGGLNSPYDAENAWTDAGGALHLRISKKSGKWTCAQAELTRSLGYGTYKFVVQDSAHLSPSAVFGLFTWDLARSQDFRNEIDIELSRWGDPKSKNAQYVIQPFYVAQNVSRFTVPAGAVTHSFRWEPAKVSFTSMRGNGDSSSAAISRHIFTAGIPSPADEAVHINLYDFRHSRNPVQQPSEVVIEKFEYLP